MGRTRGKKAHPVSSQPCKICTGVAMSPYSSPAVRKIFNPRKCTGVGNPLIGERSVAKLSVNLHGYMNNEPLSLKHYAAFNKRVRGVMTMADSKDMDLDFLENLFSSLGLAFDLDFTPTASRQPRKPYRLDIHGFNKYIQPSGYGGSAVLPSRLIHSLAKEAVLSGWSIEKTTEFASEHHIRAPETQKSSHPPYATRLSYSGAVTPNPGGVLLETDDVVLPEKKELLDHYIGPPEVAQYSRSLASTLDNPSTSDTDLSDDDLSKTDELHPLRVPLPNNAHVPMTFPPLNPIIESAVDSSDLQVLQQPSLPSPISGTTSTLPTLPSVPSSPVLPPPVYPLPG